LGIFEYYVGIIEGAEPCLIRLPLKISGFVIFGGRKPFIFNDDFILFSVSNLRCFLLIEDVNEDDNDDYIIEGILKIATPMPTKIPTNFLESSDFFSSVTMLVDRIVNPSAPSWIASSRDSEILVASSFVFTIRRRVVLMDPHDMVFGTRTPLSFAEILNKALIFS
jgi:hypothetical protein